LRSLIQRNSVGLAVDLTSSVSFEFGQSNDSTTYGKLSIKFPFSRHHKSLDFAVSDTAFLSSSKLDL
jgi:hypothetical protein